MALLKIVEAPRKLAKRILKFKKRLANLRGGS
jgi:hypothetical protein